MGSGFYMSYKKQIIATREQIIKKNLKSKAAAKKRKTRKERWRPKTSSEET